MMSDEIPPSHAADWLLQNFVTVANHLDGGGLQVTLTVGGLLISGRIISGKEYVEKILAQEMEDFTEGEEVWDRYIAYYFGSAMKTYMNVDPWEALKKYGDEIEEAKPELPDLAPEPYFIHLSDARYFGATGVSLTSQPMLWRGRLSDVSGFHLGQIVPG